jgi:hypothetical protein
MPREIAFTTDQLIKRDTPDELKLLAEDITECHQRVVNATGDALRYALEAGELLHEAKAKVRYGGWERWLERSLPGELSKTMARIYMRLWTYREQVEGRADSIRLAMNMIAGEPNSTGLEDKRQAARTLHAQDPERWTMRALAERFQVSPSTAQLWTNPETNRKAQARGREAYRPKRKVITCPHCGKSLHKDGTPVRESGETAAHEPSTASVDRG